MEQAMGSQSPALRLLIVDDQPLIRRALALTLCEAPGIEVVGEAADGHDAINKAASLEPDVIIMDLQMPHVGGVVATRKITARQPDTRVVVLTTFDHDDLVFDAIRAGAHAYLLKDATEDVVLDTIYAVHRGESRLSPSIARKVLDQFRQLPRHDGAAADSAAHALAPALEGPAPAANPGARLERADLLEEPLTSKEQRVLDLIAEGVSNKEIASTVFLAEGTVKNYVSRIMAKLHARNRIELAVRVVARRD
ncbi:MAG: response regulator transcription factor [Burkholderiales bacterium]|nr:response regulator transcription factor [Burkholderiales bacterium]